MSIRQPIHWHEGMFLHPHHFQTFQRAVDDALVAERELARSYSYGLVELRLSDGVLATKKVKIERLRVVLPGGVELRVPEHVDLATLDIKAAFDASDAPITIALALPIYHGDRPNQLDLAEPLETRRYSMNSVDRRDENSGDNAQSVQVRRYNARLMIAPEAPVGDLEIVPLFRVARGVGDRLDVPVLDEAYVPPTIFAHAWPPLRERAEGVVARSDSAHAQLLNRMIGEGFTADRMQPAQVHQLIKLQTLARSAARLKVLVASPSVRPFELFLELRSVAADLLALEPGRKEDALPDYDHDDLSLPFGKLFALLDRLLVVQVRRNVRMQEFVNGDRVRLATLDDDDVRLPNEYFLAVQSTMNPQEIVAIVQNRIRFKVMSERKAHDAVYGIEVREERAPVGLPTPANVYYFRLLVAGDDYSKAMWKSIVAEKRVAIRWPNMDATDFRKLTLCMIVPDRGGAQ